MNFLGHLWVARRTNTSPVGSMLGDFVKGDASREWSGELLEGIELHRRVDTFTDSHAAFRRTRDRLDPRLRRYAGIVVDILWDHVLARDWDEYDDEPLRTVADGMYHDLMRAAPVLPEGMLRFVRYALATDVFWAYRTVDGIDRVMKGVSRRLTRENPIHEAAAEIAAQGDALADDFREFAAALRTEFAPSGDAPPAA